MPTYDYLVIAMMITFIALLFTGFPIAWILGGRRDRVLDHRACSATNISTGTPSS